MLGEERDAGTLLMCMACSEQDSGSWCRHSAVHVHLGVK